MNWKFIIGCSRFFLEILGAMVVFLTILIGFQLMIKRLTGRDLLSEYARSFLTVLTSKSMKYFPPFNLAVAFVLPLLPGFDRKKFENKKEIINE